MNSQATDQREAITRLLELTGVTTQLKLVQELVAESSIANTARCNSNAINTALPSFSAESIVFDTVSVLSKSNTASLESVTSWYTSPLAIKIREAEKNPVDFDDLSAFVQTARFKNQNRKALIQSIVSNTLAPEFVATIGAEIEYAGIVHSGCIEKAAINGKANYEQTLADATRNDKEITAMLLRSDINTEAAYIYRTLSANELSRFAAFTASENSQLFYRNLVNSISYSLALAADRLSISTSQSLYSTLDF